jgi:hypothetical protein
LSSRTPQTCAHLEDVWAIKITDYEALGMARDQTIRGGIPIAGYLHKQIFEDGFFPTRILETCLSHPACLPMAEASSHGGSPLSILAW